MKYKMSKKENFKNDKRENRKNNIKISIKSNLLTNKKIVFCIITFLVIAFLNQNVFAASDPTLVNKLNTVFKKLQSYLVKLATPVAGVAIGVGVMMRKLSFGDEEKMIKGKRTIVNAIIGYSIIISINLIIKFIDALLG